MQKLECAQLFEGCPGVVEAETTDQVLAQAAAHAAEVHGVESFDDQTLASVRSAITTS